MDPLPTEPKRGSLLVIFLTVFIDLLGFGMVLPLLPIYGEQFAKIHGLTREQSGAIVGLLMASFSAMQFLFAPMWGKISDRIGRRPVLMIGLGGSVLFYTLFGIATVWQSLPLLFLARIGAGIAGATISTAQAYIADTTTLEKRTKGMALIGAAFGMGFTFGPLLGYLAVPSGRGDPGPGPGYVAGALSFVALMLAYFLLPESLHARSKSAAKKLFDFQTLKTALTMPSIGPLLLSLFVCIFAFANFETTLSMLVKGEEVGEATTDPIALATRSTVDAVPRGRASAAQPDRLSAAERKIRDQSPYNFTFRQVCLTYAFIGISLTFAQGFLVRRLSGTISEGVLASCGAVLEVCGFGIMIYAIHSASVYWLFGALFIVVVGFALMMPSLNSLISRRSDPAKQGSILGVGQSVSSLARILGPMVAIPVLVADITLPYKIAAGMMVVGLGLVIFSTRAGKDYATPGAEPAQPMLH
ncbi:MAG TPA: MFS transporter [Pirellulales bacterium]|jgi:MFS family permease|nr:MFS transporter [Pirellulales bacterium]